MAISLVPWPQGNFGTAHAGLGGRCPASGGHSQLAVAQKPVPKWLALVSGNMNQNLRFAPPVYFLSHTQLLPRVGIDAGGRGGGGKGGGGCRPERGLGLSTSSDERSMDLALFGWFKGTPKGNCQF